MAVLRHQRVLCRKKPEQQPACVGPQGDVTGRRNAGLRHPAVGCRELLMAQGCAPCRLLAGLRPAIVEMQLLSNTAGREPDGAVPCWPPASGYPARGTAPRHPPGILSKLRRGNRRPAFYILLYQLSYGRRLRSCRRGSNPRPEQSQCEVWPGYDTRRRLEVV